MKHELFGFCRDRILEACLSGTMGTVTVRDDSAVAVLGDFAFLGGKPDRALLECCRGALLLRSCAPGWDSLVEETLGAMAQRWVRYAMKAPDAFDIPYLETLTRGLDIREMEERYYQQCVKERWSRDLAGQYDNYVHFHQAGLGLVAVASGKIVGGAASYATFPGGIALQVSTNPDCRGQGIGAGCSAALILACLKRGLEPDWDAHTLISRKLAEKLGYRLNYEYPVRQIDWSGVPLKF